jgi:type IV secretion system protein VirB5
MKTATTVPTGQTLYLEGRRVWNERYGEYLGAANAWRKLALICAATTTLSVAGNIYQSSRSHLVPYVIEVGQMGMPVNAGFANEASATDPRIMKALIGSFISDIRSVIADASAEKIGVTRAFHFLREGDPAHATIVEFLTNDGTNPFKRAETETITVQVNSLLPITDKTWQVEWEELVRNRQGMEIERYHMKAMLAVTTAQSTDESVLSHNPIGLFIKEVSWNRVL